MKFVSNEMIKERPKESLWLQLTQSKFFTFGITIVLFISLYLFGAMSFRGFSKPQVFYNLFIDYAPTIILTVGMTFVLLTGHRDLSGGAVIAFICMFIAKLLRDTSMPIGLVIIVSLLIGTLFGFIQGYLITRFQLQSYIITLAGQFLARGATAMISVNTIDIIHPGYTAIAGIRIPLIGGYISFGSAIAIVVLIGGTIFLSKTRLGRRMYAVGGDAHSSELMGIKPDNTVLSAFTMAGFFSALAGICYSLIMLSGYTLHGVGLEMEAISASVIGGTVLSGGIAFLPGTLIGVLIQGTIQTLITFQGTLSAWWTKIVIASLLCLSIVVQSMFAKTREKNK